MLELPKPKPKRNVRSGAAHSRLLLRFLPQRLATRLHLSLAKHLVNRSRRRMSQTAENLICRAKGGPKKGCQDTLRKARQINWSQFQFQFQAEAKAKQNCIQAARIATGQHMSGAQQDTVRTMHWLLVGATMISFGQSQRRGQAKPGRQTRIHSTTRLDACRLLLVALVVVVVLCFVCLCVGSAQHRSHPCRGRSSKGIAIAGTASAWAACGRLFCQNNTIYALYWEQSG